MEDIYWADKIASKIIKRGKEIYTVASGISPSGVIHIGNFREEMTVEIVKRALESKGAKVRYIHSWDNFDRLRKIPSNVPSEFSIHLGKPLSDVPDPWKCHDSYAQHFEKQFEKEAVKVRIVPEYLNQAKIYRNCTYHEFIKLAIHKKDIIIKILNKFRKEPLGKDWYPVQIYCLKCNKDSTKIESYDGEYTLEYKCKCGHESKTDFSKEGNVKLRWRTDWAMRWFFYEVDFEPGGKEHSTPGGSRDTSAEISREVFTYSPPEYQFYDFVILKGSGGKMSGSKGNVVSLEELNQIYLPEIVRYFYAGTRPGSEFTIPMDDEIFKVYEDFYSTERIYFEKEKTNEKNAVHLKRVYEMSVIGEIPKTMPVQVPFRYVVMLSQIYKDRAKIIDKLKQSKHIPEDIPEKDLQRINAVIQCSENWANLYADERYILEIQEESNFELTENEKKAVNLVLENLDSIDENKLYEIGKESGLGKDFFKLCYRIILNKNSGPKLIELIDAIGKEKLKKIFLNCA